MDWEPISIDDLFVRIRNSEERLRSELLNFWNLIQIYPTKWQERSYGKEGGGFWVVAIIGEYVIWFNDIEDGFNISRYKEYGEIREYWCNQDELHISVEQVYSLIRYGGTLVAQAGPPESLEP
ncbi:hypothetical protein [Leptospira stimsonii]|uniref:YdhG-like domain-containing protein n=1 Tax=Leptospira stimsonii TaxID=2202203 RepID=A0ABY2N9Q7_9LEPT|nr:hypothetical protein [Leptospira stimsonii]TGK19024.1 hypothetical protein EHO98_12050 [Leptospira stimsonii]TGM18953.1 hypothetical protein EHQ90_05345 [Leptospira stimsonii]